MAGPKVVSVELRAKVEGFTAGMRSAKKSVDDLTKADVPKAARGFKDLSDKAALAGAAMAVGLGVAVKRFADFDSAMSAVKANVGGTVEEMERLRQAALTLGADSQFSATEAAQGINELGKAGIQTADILNGGLKGALDLAAAGQISVAQAAETTASAMTQFGLQGDDAVKVADLLANGANKAQGGVGDLGAALGQAGLVAAATGLSIEETAAGLTAFASAGLIGSDAGTSFKTMLQRLSAPSGEAAAKMAELGISAYDAQGNFVGLEAVAGQLQAGMEDLDPATRNAAMATIFGSDAVRASNVLYQEGAAGIRAWTDEVTVQGAAAAQAATLTDNLTGDIERLGGAFDSVLIQTGSGANDSLRTLTQGLEGLVTVVGKIPGPVLLAGTGLAAIALTVPKGISAFRNYTATLDSVGLSFDKIAARGPRAAKGVELAGKAAGVAGKAFVGLAVAAAAAEILGDDVSVVGVQGLTADLLAADDAVAKFSASVKANAAEMGNIQGNLENYGDVLRATFDPNFLDSFTRKGDAFLGAISLGMIDLTTTTDDAAARLGDLDGVLAGLVASGNADQAATLFEEFAAAAEEQGVNIDALKTKLPGYSEALAGADNAQRNAVGSGAALATSTEDLATQAEKAEDALSALKDAIDGLGSPTAAARAANREFQAAIDAVSASIEENGKTLNINTAEGRANQAALDDIRNATLDKVQADFELTGSTEAATTAMQNGRDAFVDAAIQAGLTKTKAEELATQLGLIPEDVSILVSQSGAEAAAAQISGAAVDRYSTIWVTRRFRGSDLSSDFQGVGGRAGGGPIWGPGTKTSDSVPIWASQGEFMQKAAAVDKYGYGFMEAVNSLRFPVELARGLARGGPVTPQYAPPTQYVQSMGGPTTFSETRQTPVFVTGPVTVGTLGDVGTKAEAETWRQSVGRQL